MIRCENLSFSYGDKKVIKDVSFDLEEGKIVALLGVNGSGKTTLLKIISRLLNPQKGKVFIDNKQIRNMSEQEIAKIIAYMPQKSNGVFCSVFDAVLLGRRPHIGLDASRHDIEITSNILKMLGLADYAFRSTVELSGGELQKVMIARALAQEPKVLLLDEPINHLDIKNQLDIMSLIKEITKKMRLTTVIVLHDLMVAMRFAGRFLFLKDGEVYSYGDKEIITSQTIKDVYSIDAKIEKVKDVEVVVPYLG